MPKRIPVTFMAMIAAVGPAFAHLDPVAHGTGSADHHHPFIGIEPLVVVALAVVAALAVAGGIRARSAARKRDRR